MPKFYPSLTPDLTTWLLSQPVFFTASAPLSGKHVNISPKGLPSRSFRVLSPNRVAYLDATGSGCETVSHIYENRRVTVMFTSFSRSPRILRLFCTGRVVEVDDVEFGKLLAEFGDSNGGEIHGIRAVIVLDIFKVQTSCGFGVPLVREKGEGGEVEAGAGVFEDRDTLDKWARTFDKRNLETYRAEWNSGSLDGLPGLRSARRRNGERALWVRDVLVGVRRVGVEWGGMLVGFGFGVGFGIGVGVGVRGYFKFSGRH